ncbi:MAG TPA: hypothetical protein VGV60_14965 [Candidatus Polarisedimenticolia bacterium]|nr:hypothetical protein [Candidatus Polarisedimenticolia bacterium]
MSRDAAVIDVRLRAQIRRRSFWRVRFLLWRFGWVVRWFRFKRWLRGLFR